MHACIQVMFCGATARGLVMSDVYELRRMIPNLVFVLLLGIVCRVYMATTYKARVSTRL
jgi:hypothetical protein